MRINPELPTVGGDIDTWGDENNAALAASILQTNDHDDRLISLEIVGLTTATRLTALETTVRQLQSAISILSGGGTPGATVGIDADGAPYIILPSAGGSAYLTEDGDRLLSEVGDVLVVE